MVQLERGGRHLRVVDAAAGRARGGQQNRRPQALAFPERVVGDEIVERPVPRLAVADDDALDLLEHHSARLGENALY